MSWRERFGVSGPPLPRGAASESFFDQGPHSQRLTRVFAWLAAELGNRVVSGESASSRPRRCATCVALPHHEHRVVYLADITVKPLDRMLAAAFGLRPGPRAQIVGDIKRARHSRRPARRRPAPHPRRRSGPPRRDPSGRAYRTLTSRRLRRRKMRDQDTSREQSAAASRCRARRARILARPAIMS